jgi:hypothetical protein
MIVMEDKINTQMPDSDPKRVTPDKENSAEASEIVVNDTALDINANEESNGVSYELFSTKVNQ